MSDHDTLIQDVTYESFSITNGDSVLHEITETELIEQGIMGPPGPPGPAGPQGPTGPPGSSTGEGGVEVPTFPITDPKQSANLAAGASVNLDSVVIPAATVGKLQQVTLSSSAPCKWEVKKSTAGVDTTLDVVFTSGNTGNSPSHEWEPPHRDYAQLAGNGTTTFFRVSVTNLDGRNAANVYSTFFFDEVTA